MAPKPTRRPALALAALCGLLATRLAFVGPRVGRSGAVVRGGASALLAQPGGGPIIDAEEVIRSPAPAAAAATAAEAAVSADDALAGRRKVAVITGASTGIGLATVEGMVRSGMYSTIILAGRDTDKHERAIQTLKARFDLSGPSAVELRHLPLELASLRSVRDFAAAFLGLGLPLHTLVLNAGVMALPERRTTEDGLEFQFGVNHVAHFLLGNLLLDALVAAGTPTEPSRLIVLSSSAHQIPSPLLQGDLSDLQSRDYSPWGAYGQSKLANVLFAYELDRRCRERGLPVAVNAVHPGAVDTELARYLTGTTNGRPAVSGGPFGQALEAVVRPLLSRILKTPEEGAKTSVLLATRPEGATISGKYWQDGRPAATLDVDPLAELPEPLRAMLPARPRLTSYDPQTWSELWRLSEALAGFEPSEVAAWRQAAHA